MLSEEEKNKKTEYGKNRYCRYRHMSEEKKKRLKKYQKIIVRQKSFNIIMNKITVTQIKQFFNYDLIKYAI